MGFVLIPHRSVSGPDLEVGRRDHHRHRGLPDVVLVGHFPAFNGRYRQHEGDSGRGPGDITGALPDGRKFLQLSLIGDDHKVPRLTVLRRRRPPTSASAIRFKSASDTGSGLYCRTLRRARIASQASMSSFRLRRWRQCDRDLVYGITSGIIAVMGMTLRTSDQQTEALRRQAAARGGRCKLSRYRPSTSTSPGERTRLRLPRAAARRTRRGRSPGAPEKDA